MIKFNLTEDSKPIIKVIGVGGGGSNAVSYMFSKGIEGVDFAICNTDNQAMNTSVVENKIQLGPSLTEGRGAGSKPNIGRESCLESIEDVMQYVKDGTKMLFVTAGMGGGTGTGAAPVIAKAAREMDILTVGIVTIPFSFEGKRRTDQAMDGLSELQKNVDTLIVISNDKLRKIYGNLNLSEAFGKADDILMTAAKGIAEIITVPGYVNVDFEDVNTVMRDSGVAVMGTATMEGEDRALRAVEAALQSPLLEDSDIQGAQHVLLNISSGVKEVTMDEVGIITEYVQNEAGYADLIWGNCFDEKLGDKISVTVVATGFQKNQSPQKDYTQKQNHNPQKRVSLEEDQAHNKVNLDQNEDAQQENFIDFKLNNSSNSDVSKNEDVDQNSAFDQPSETLEERRRRLKNISLKLNNPEVLNEMENKPAYMRKGVALDEVEQSSEENLSNWVITDNDEPEIKDNSFLHDNLD